VEIDLVANNLRKSPQGSRDFSIKFITIRGRYLALWRLGALGNRGVEPATVLSTLLRYSRDPNQQTRFWAVEGLAMLGTAESIDALLSVLAHDPANKFANARLQLARSGMLTGEQRLTAFLNCSSSRRHSVEPATKTSFTRLCIPLPARRSATIPRLARLVGTYDRPENRVHVPKGLLSLNVN